MDLVQPYRHLKLICKVKFPSEVEFARSQVSIANTNLEPEVNIWRVSVQSIAASVFSSRGETRVIVSKYSHNWTVHPESSRTNNYMCTRRTYNYYAMHLRTHARMTISRVYYMILDNVWIIGFPKYWWIIHSALCSPRCNTANKSSTNVSCCKSKFVAANISWAFVKFT